MTPGPALHVDAAIERDRFRLEVDVDAEPGEVLGVLGPNGAGKTTLLRAIAGLTPVTRGRISLGDEVLVDTDAGVARPADQRPVGVVFQDYRLFGHLSVRDNVAFAPRNLGVPRRAARAAADGWLARLGLAELADRRPAQLSGGQAQRVALARALAADPAVLLLDEPLAALDARTRLEVRGELRRHLADFPGPTLVVTHDPLEAMIMTDRLVVVEDGRVTQRGTSAEIARRPVTEYTARLVGLNLYRGRQDAGHLVELGGGGRLTVAGGGPGQDVLVAVRPSSIALHTVAPDHLSTRNVWPGAVRGLELLTDRVRVQVAGPPDALVDITPDAVAALRLAAGDEVWLSVKATDLDVYPDPAGPGIPVSGAS
jgi:molybdate transport system ATP-binding protein